MASNLRKYELTFILPPALSDEDIQGVQETVTGWLGNAEAEITKTNHWGRRRLAYPIDNYKEGYYILIEFDCVPAGIADVDRRIRLDGSIIRHLIINVDV